jgi:hypothetical protein
MLLNYANDLTSADRKAFKTISGNQKNYGETTAKAMNKYIKAPEPVDRSAFEEEDDEAKMSVIPEDVSVATAIVKDVKKKAETKAKEGDPLAEKIMTNSEKVNNIIAMLPPQDAS